MNQTKATMAQRFALDPRTATALGLAERGLGRLEMLAEVWPLWPGFVRGPLTAMAVLAELQARGHELPPLELLAVGPEPQPTRPSKPLRLAVGHTQALRALEALPPGLAIAPSQVGAALTGLEAPQLSRARQPEDWGLQNTPPGAGVWAHASRWMAAGLPALVTAGLALATWEREGPDDARRGPAGRVLLCGLAPSLGLPAAAFLCLRPALEQAASDLPGGCQGLLAQVRSSGAWRSWLLAFLAACRISAEMAAQAALAVHRLQAEHRDLVRTWVRAPRHPLRLLDLLVSRPLIDLPTVAGQLAVTQRTAGLLVNKLLEMGLLVETTGQRRGRRFAYSALINQLWPAPETL